ncbi:hypothetical protein [Cochleicola gelatinilyticus]|uniref:Uncharacterized protein n=1 Tax=Cochleicola gelatinilyticus TaxID=1763537 RepID=A0A167HUG6_9FLAO|nr:hypothetical protein [Cochleicola gelatinilyticus]OAB78975.1 hypothetical protein ULVI_10405 [Cochleicola gelatinilyticus]
MKSIKFLAMAAIVSFGMVSCSDDDDNGGEIPSEDLRVELYASSNTDGNVTKYDMSDMSNTTSEMFVTLSTDSEGLYYDDDTNELTLSSRAPLQLNTYANIDAATDGVTLNATISSSPVLLSPRDLAVNDDIYVVSDNADVDGDTTTNDGRLFVFVKGDNGFTLRNTVTVDFAVWGIEFVGNNLYAVVDKTNQLAVFTNFSASNTTDATVAASKTITVEGIVRTHGIGYDDGTMILTDIGDAAVDNDGGFHIITDFDSKFSGVADGGTLAVSDQVRVAGSNTFLGNPISAEFDSDTNTVFIAERANGGGRVLAFTNADAGGNIAPSVNNTLSGASSLYFYSE